MVDELEIAQKENAPFFSYIVPVYNAEKWLKKCLSSIRRQSFKNFEAIVIDDGSSDNSFSIANSFSEDDPRFKVYKQENMGSSAAYNRGLQLSKGRYLVFLDNDDWQNSEALLSTYNIISKDEADIVQFATISVNSETMEESSPQYSEAGRFIGQFQIKEGYLANRFNSLTHSGKAIRKELLMANQLSFNGHAKGADLFFIRKVFAVANVVSVNPEAIWFMRVRADSQSHKSIGKNDAVSYHQFGIDSVFNDLPFYKKALPTDLLYPIWQLNNLAYDSFFALEIEKYLSGSFDKNECARVAKRIWRNRKYLLRDQKRRFMILLMRMFPLIAIRVAIKRHS